MSSKRRGGGDHGGGGGGHGSGDERWMASYMDMVTVLMCLFIVLYAMSTVDQTKFEKLKLALATGFGEVSSDTVDTAEGFVVPEELIDSIGAAGPAEISQLTAAAGEYENLAALEERISERLESAGVAESVTFAISERGLTVELVGAAMYFAGNSSRLNPTAKAVVTAIAAEVRDLPNLIAVEGHADPRGSAAPYASDWELSGARAISVLRHLVEVDGVESTRVSATAYGSAHPISEGDAQLNRRVDVVILSEQPEAVRDLIPEVAQAEGADTATSGSEPSSEDGGASDDGGASGGGGTPGGASQIVTPSRKPV